MTSVRLNPDEDDVVQEAAADWLIRRERGLSSAEQDEYLQWLGRDPRHRAWIGFHEKTWREFDLLAQWRPEHGVEPNPDLLARPRSAQRRRAVFSLVALAACLAVTVAWWQGGGMVVENAVASSGGSAVALSYERRTLAEGSVVELNAGAAVDVRLTTRKRHVTLLQGEALFTVSPDAARPFVVRAGGVDVRAVGTAFSVRLGSGAVEVLVTEGRVQVARQSAGAADPSPAPIVAAGHRAIVDRSDRAAPRIAAVSAEEISRDLAWQVRLLDFSSTPLAEVVAELNACNRVQLVLADAELAVLPIVASLHSNNIEALVRLLESTADVQAERAGDTIVLRRKR